MFNEIIKPKETLARKDVFLMVNKRFLNQIADEIVKNPDPYDETGGLILGIREVRKDNQVFIVPLGSINSKDQEELERQHAHLNIGGPLTNISRVWQVENWLSTFPSVYKDFVYDPKNPNTKLTILGIWHKHPGTFIGYSGEDSGTVDNILKTSGKKDFLFPIAILRDQEGNQQIPGAVKLKLDNNSYIDIKFYYRASAGEETSVITPEIYDSYYFPSLATSPWYVENPAKFKDELSAFQKVGLKVAIKHTQRPGLKYPETWLVVTHKDLEKPSYIRMSYNFPNDRMFFITQNDPGKDDDFTGTVLTTDGTIAETIRPIIFEQKI